MFYSTVSPLFFLGGLGSSSLRKNKAPPTVVICSPTLQPVLKLCLTSVCSLNGPSLIWLYIVGFPCRQKENLCMWPAVRAEKHRSEKSEEEALSLFEKTDVVLWNRRPNTTTVVTYLRHNHVQFTKNIHLAAGIQRHVIDNINVLLLCTFSLWQQLHEYADLTKPSCMTSRPFSTTVGRDFKCSLIFIHYGGGYQYMRRARCILGHLIGEKYKFIGLLLVVLKLKVGVAVSALLLLVDEKKKVDTQRTEGGSYYPFNAETFSTRPHCPHYRIRSLRPYLTRVTVSFVVTL